MPPCITGQSFLICFDFVTRISLNISGQITPQKSKCPSGGGELFSLTYKNRGKIREISALIVSQSHCGRGSQRGSLKVPIMPKDLHESRPGGRKRRIFHQTAIKTQ